MSAKRPLLDTKADRRLFVDDTSRQLAMKSAFQLHNTLIVGEWGSGKTSLLYNVRGNANERGSAERSMAVLIDARVASGPGELVELLIQEAVDGGWIDPLEDRRVLDDDPFALVSQIRRLRAAPENSMVLIDDPDAEQAAVMFGRLRDELWQLPVWFTVAVNPTIETAVLRQPPADAFFDTRIELEPFSPRDATEILARRRPDTRVDTPAAPKQSMQPRALLVRAEPGVAGVRYDGELQSRLLTQAEQVAGRSGATLLGEIWNRGAVSASDSALQQSLGISRARLTQLLTTLERDGVLISFTQSTAGAQGRPRTMYDINRDP